MPYQAALQTSMNQPDLLSGASMDQTLCQMRLTKAQQVGLTPRNFGLWYTAHIEALRPSR